MLLGIKSNSERRNIDNLLSNTDVSLSDEHTGVVDGGGKTLLDDLGLKTTLHESLRGKLKDVIKSVLLVGH